MTLPAVPGKKQGQGRSSPTPTKNKADAMFALPNILKAKETSGVSLTEKLLHGKLHAGCKGFVRGERAAVCVRCYCSNVAACCKPQTLLIHRLRLT